MSRKNKNARRTGHTRPIIVETTSAHAAGPRMTMCDDKCGYEYKPLMSGLLETDASYQRKVDLKRVEKMAMTLCFSRDASFV